MSSHRSPKELIELYWTEVWNNRNAEMIRELCADPIVRHDPGSVTALPLEDQIARVRQQSEHAEPFFEHEVLHADDTFVTSVWNMHTRKGARVELCGIEVFKAENGKFTHCWNSSYVAGRWGREGDKSVPDNLPPPAFIFGASNVTPAWLQSVFQHAGLDAPRISIVGVEPIGHGNLSETVKANITYNANAANAISSVVCKLTSAIPGAVDIAGMQDVYAREVAVYQLFGSAPPLNVPRAYLASASPDGRALNLVLEDLSRRTSLGNQIKGCSPAEAAAVVEQFAKLHAKYWKDPAIQSAGWLLKRKDNAAHTDETFRAGAAIFRQRFEGRMDARHLDGMDRFLGHAADWTRRKTGTETLVHGEARVDNVLFEQSEAGLAAWLIDWQFADLGSPMFDTAYFLAGSLASDQRKACERDLIARHQSAIAARDPSYSLDRALADYAAALPFALFTTVGAATVIPPGEHSDELLMTLLRRNVEALIDWNVFP
ncbi:MAG: phosphotransferase [Acidobacteria bacterium]|nr:phosphotransferase [Acidobacteriota bacterium]